MSQPSGRVSGKGAIEAETDEADEAAEVAEASEDEEVADAVEAAEGGDGEDEAGTADDETRPRTTRSMARVQAMMLQRMDTAGM
jgi:hypothetical protein